MSEYSQNVWKNYGLKANPFNTRALSLKEKDILTIEEAFVGRGKQSRESIFLTNILRNPGGGCFVVEGEVGVGKTSFVNYHRAIWERLAKDKILTTLEEISVSRFWTLKEFLKNLLGALMERFKEPPFSQKIIDGDPRLKEIDLLCNVYLGESYHFGASLFGSGGALGKEESLNIPQVPEFQLRRYFQYLVEKAKEKGYEGIFIHLDNLELISWDQIKEAQLLFEDLRDTLQTPDVYFALVAYRGFYLDIIAPRERLKSIFLAVPFIYPL